jgi:signal transduction histidine kinase
MIKTIYDILKKESERLVKVEKLYTIGQLAARLVHDMRNPLAVIKMTMAMLLTGSDKIDGDIKEKYKLIERSTNRMIHQVNDVMDFVRTRELQLQQNSLKDIVHSASLTTKIPQNVSLNLPQNDVRLRCDKKQLEVMISNLLSNSVEAIDQNQGIITIKLYEEPKNAFIEVEDSGPGIPDNVMPKIFEPLFSTKAAGTGLGLLSCINIVNAHNGTIKVKNNPTRFIISIPKS